MVLGQFRQVLGCAAGKDAAVDGRVQCLDPSAQNFGKTSQIFDRNYRQTRVRQLAGRTATGDQLDAGGMQTSGEFE